MGENEHFIPRKRQNLFSENKKPRFWDIVALRHRAVAPPKIAKKIFFKIRMSDFWTSTILRAVVASRNPGIQESRNPGIQESDFTETNLFECKIKI
jgi:hypothetical protein